MKLKARMSFSRYQGGDRGHGISIRIEDASSNCEIFYADVSMETFGNLVSGLSYQEVDAEWNIKNLGLQCQYKTESVLIPEDFTSYSMDLEDKKEILKAYEVDGWKADYDDLGNHHKSLGQNRGYKVGFTRFVPMEENVNEK